MGKGIRKAMAGSKRMPFQDSDPSNSLSTWKQQRWRELLYKHLNWEWTLPSSSERPPESQIFIGTTQVNFSQLEDHLKRLIRLNVQPGFKLVLPSPLLQAVLFNTRVTGQLLGP